MTGILAEGFGLGLSSGAYCFGACMPVLLPYMLGVAKQRWRANALLLGEFLAGRFAAYMVYATLASWVGILVEGRLPVWALHLAGGLSGFFLLAWAMAGNFPTVNFCRALTSWPGLQRLPFAFGFLVGINACPPFIAATLRLIGLHHIGHGLLYFIAFFAGTSLYSLPFLAVVPWLGSSRLASAGRICSVLSGLWLIAQSLAEIL
ncbi:MAG: sulfite exporter TauE/SafE family protein [Elusimicrobiota bacterium]